MPTFANTINENEILAKRSQCDYTGNDIQTTYATKTEVTTGLASKQDTISDLATIRSGASAGATAVQPGDLATVATTGAYSDLTGTPTIPTATSDLTNNSGFITLSDVPAQVNADWNSSSGASEILNKPTIPSGTQLVPAATSADADKVLTVDAQGTPAWTTPSGGSDAVFVTWDDTSAGWATMWTQVQTALSDNKTVLLKDGFCTAEIIASIQGQEVNFRGLADSTGIPPKITYNFYCLQPSFAYKQVQDQYVLPLPGSGSTGQLLGLVSSNDPPYREPSWVNVNQVPASTSADADKVLTVDSQGTPAWSTPAAGGVTDVEVDGASVVSGGVASITMPTGVPTYTTTEDGKVLGVVDNQGTAELEWVAQSAGGTQADWSEADPTAPSYIENKPVPKTLVAGTGITITETANDLTVASTNQLYNAGTGLKLTNATFSLDETVLFSSANGENLKNGITLSESRLNFNRLRITYAIATNAAPAYLEIPMMGVNTGAQFIAVLTAPFDNHAYDVAGYSLVWFTYFVDCTDTYLKSATSQFVGKSGFIDGTTAGSWAQGVNSNVPVIYEVVGVNRIAP